MTTRRPLNSRDQLRDGDLRVWYTPRRAPGLQTASFVVDVPNLPVGVFTLGVLNDLAVSDNRDSSPLTGIARYWTDRAGRSEWVSVPKAELDPAWLIDPTTGVTAQGAS